MATETLVNKKLDVDVPAEEEAVTAEGDEEKADAAVGDGEKAGAAVGDEEKLTSETEEKDVSEEEKDLKVVEEEEQEAVEEGKQTDEEGEPSKKPKASRKRSSKKGGGGELKKSAEKSIQKQPRKRSSSSKEPITPVDRPARERKSVERYSALSAEKVPASKGLSIEKGRGTQLKDIPNVAFKLSKRKSDENLQMLHTILFGKKAKVHILKRNISQFSGYVWLQNEEKQRTKVKEKIDKYVKEKLLDFCDVLDIPVSKTTAKKEELSAKLLEFLESPHATTEVSLADKEEVLHLSDVKGKKRKRKTAAGTKVTAGKASGHGSNKKPKQSPEVTKKQKHISKVEDEDETGSADTRHDPDEGDDSDRVQMEESDEGESESESAEDKTNEHMDSVKGPTKNIKGSEAKTATKNTPVKKETPTKSVKAPAKSTKGSSASALKKGTAAADRVSASPTKSKASGTKKGSENDKRSAKHSSTSTKDKSTSKKQPNKLGAKISVKEQGAGKASKKAKAEPSREEMHAVVTDIMKEVDFNTATLSDIIRQLGTHFSMDLMHRKAEVKGIIEEVINNMTDEEDDGADGEDDEHSEQAGGEADDKAGGDNDD